MVPVFRNTGTIGRIGFWLPRLMQGPPHKCPKAPLELTRPFRTYPPLQNLPTPSEFTRHLQDLPTPSEFTHPLKCIHPFRTHPPPSEFTHHPIYFGIQRHGLVTSRQNTASSNMSHPPPRTLLWPRGRDTPVSTLSGRSLANVSRRVLQNLHNPSGLTLYVGPFGPGTLFLVLFWQNFGPIQHCNAGCSNSALSTKQGPEFSHLFRIYLSPLECTHTFRVSPHFQDLPTPSELTHPLKIYPPPSGFTHPLGIYLPLQNVSTPSEFTDHLHNLPTTFRIYPPPSKFTHRFRIYPIGSNRAHCRTLFKALLLVLFSPYVGIILVLCWGYVGNLVAAVPPCGCELSWLRPTNRAKTGPTWDQNRAL